MDKKKIKKSIKYGMGALLIAVELLRFQGYHIKLLTNNGEIIDIHLEKDRKYIENSNELDEYIKDIPTFFEIREVIRNNKNLVNLDKNKLLFIVDRIEDKIPFLDTRALYENCASLKIIRDRKSDGKTAGEFMPDLKQINLYTDSFQNFSHEVLHMTNFLCFYDKKCNFIIKYFCLNNDDDYKFLIEGFNDWLNHYLFNYEYYTYSVEASDIEIFKFICKFNNHELIKTFTEDNYLSILSRVKLPELEKEELVNICKKSNNNYLDSTGKIRGSELVRKYQLLLKACLNSRKDQQSLSYLYEIEKILSDSYSKYKYQYPKEVSILNDIIHNEIIEKSKNKNEIVISNDDKIINYIDYNNLYLIYNNIGTGSFQYIIGEKYFFHEKEQYHVDQDKFREDFVNNKLLVYDNYDPEFIPVKNLIEQYGNDKNNYTLKEICNIYEKEYQKVEKREKYK